MPRDFSTDGLVIREHDLGEHDKIITLLSPMYGRITVISKGARSLKNQFMSPSRLFTYGNYELHRRGDMTWLRAAQAIDCFPQLQKDIVKLYLAQYLVDVAYDVTGENVPAVDIARLTLNSLYSLCHGNKDERLIKGTFEWRAVGYSGYMPDLSDCHRCGKKNALSKESDGICYLDVMNGALLCTKCAAGELESHRSGSQETVPVDAFGVRSILLPLNQAVLSAVRYAMDAMPERMLSFSLALDQDIETYSEAASIYLSNHLERGFASLALYKEIKRM